MRQITAIERQSMADIYKEYGYDMPIKAKYKRSRNRIYFPGDFMDGEEITFFWYHENPSICAKGYAFYIGATGRQNLINISELIPIK